MAKILCEEVGMATSILVGGDGGNGLGKASQVCGRVQTLAETQTQISYAA